MDIMREGEAQFSVGLGLILFFAIFQLATIVIELYFASAAQEYHENNHTFLSFVFCTI
jgi:hypothetical protein